MYIGHLVICYVFSLACRVAGSLPTLSAHLKARAGQHHCSLTITCFLFVFLTRRVAGSLPTLSAHLEARAGQQRAMGPGQVDGAVRAHTHAAGCVWAYHVARGALCEEKVGCVWAHHVARGALAKGGGKRGRFGYDDCGEGGCNCK